jgi:hypothetical protein
MGWPVMNCILDDSHRNVGGRVVGNTLTGAFFHYGLVVNGVWDWTAKGNVSTAVHSGLPVSICSLPSPSPPGAFLFDADRVDGVFQPEFVDAAVDALLGVHD